MDSMRAWYRHRIPRQSRAYASCAEQPPQAERWQPVEPSRRQEPTAARDWRRQAPPAPSPSAARSRRAERSRLSSLVLNRGRLLPERLRPPAEPQVRVLAQARSRQRALPEPGLELAVAAALSARLPLTARLQARRRRQSPAHPAPSAAPEQERLRPPAEPAAQARQLRPAQLRRRALARPLLPERARPQVAPASCPTEPPQAARRALHQSR